MAAANTDNFTQVSVAGSQTTLAAPGKSIGASSINLTSGTGWPTATGIILAMRRVDANGVYQAGTYTEWAGVLSGTTITLNTTPIYGTDQTYAADGLTQVYQPVSATWANRIINTLLLDHLQNGGHAILHDTNGNAILDLQAATTAINWLQIFNSATGNALRRVATGGDSNIDVRDEPKGTGKYYVKGRADGWNDLSGFGSFTYNANNGQKEFVVTTPSDLSSFLSAGMKIRFDRGTAPPTQSMAFASASSQYATKSSPSGITFTTAFTCEGWICPLSYTGQNQGIIGRTDGSTGGFFLSLNSSGQLNIGYAASSAFTQWATYQSIPLNRWVHVAGVVSSVASKTLQGLYINGVSVPTFSVASAATTLTQTSNLSVGAFGAGVANTFFNGYISEGRIWSVAQTSANILANMAISLTGSETNLVFLGQGNGNFNDKTSNANNLTATNGAIATQAANPYNATEYGFITKVTSTQLTIFTGTDCTIPNQTLSSPNYSTSRAPYGFPAGRDKWVAEMLDRTPGSQTSPTNLTWYNINSDQLSVPTGEWLLSYWVNANNINSMNPAAFKTTLSTANNTESDTDFSCRLVTTTASANSFDVLATKAKMVNLSSQTTYYLNEETLDASAASLNLHGDAGTTIIRAECAFV